MFVGYRTNIVKMISWSWSCRWLELLHGYKTLNPGPLKINKCSQLLSQP